MMIVRQAERSDVADIAEFQIRMAHETEELDLDRQTVDLGVTAVFDDPSKGAYWVAESDDRVVGCLLTVPEWSDWRNGTVLWIHSVFVVPEMRRSGVFREMYDALRKEVEQSSNLRGLRLYVEQENERAQAVYCEMGMENTRYHLFEWMRDGW